MFKPIFIAMSLLTCSLAAAETSSVDLIIHNGNITTMGPRVPKAQALAVRKGKIVGIGKNADVLSQFTATKKIDLRGGHVLPGLIDSHGHLHSLGQKSTKADLAGAKSIPEVIERLKKFARTSNSTWIIGRGWDQNDWPGRKFPTKKDLDAAFPNTPVYLSRVDGHAAWANSKALSIAGVTRRTPNPEGGIIVKDSNGEPTGVFIDLATRLVSKHVPSATPAQLEAGLKLAMKELSALGITTVHDAGIGADGLARFQKLKANGDLKVRVYGMFSGAGSAFTPFCNKGPIVDSMVSLRAVKLFIDGTLGSRGAALLEDYSDQPGHKGLLLNTQKEINAAVLKANNCGFQVGVHAIGDRGNRVVLNAIEAAIKKTGRDDLRPRIEHAQVLDPSDFHRFKQSDIIASMQPVHATDDMPWAEERVGHERITSSYAWRSFLDHGVLIASGSDFPISEPNPFHGIYAAVSRKDLSGSPRGGWYPSQKMNRVEALRSFTTAGAYAAFMEKQIGSLEVGKFADFIIVDRDLLRVPEAELPETKVLSTYLNGKKVY